MIKNFGYCCINLSLNHIKVNRGMIKKTFEQKGLSYAGELALANLIDLEQIIHWNFEHGIHVYRLSSDMFPWMSEYQFEELPNFDDILIQLQQIGKLSRQFNQRLTFHPGHFSVLASENSKVVQKAIKDINQHAQILDFMQLPQTVYHAINVHINTTKPTKQSAGQRFCENFHHLSVSAQRRLTVENDDSPNQYSVLDLFNQVYENIQIPIVFDFLHYQFGEQNQSLEDAFLTSYITWPENITPLTHYASSRRIEDPKAKVIAHADLIHEQVPELPFDFDVEFECKAKDLALFEYHQKWPLFQQFKT